MKALEAHRTIGDLLSSHGIEEPQAKAQVIVSHVLGDDILNGVSNAAWSKILGMANRACKGEPVEYITGRAYFRYLELSVCPDVLIPRQETELVAGAAIDLIRQNGYTTALDMCTGSGCIAISLATETDALVQAVDISEKAVDIAQSNAKLSKAEIEFTVSDMFEDVAGSFDIIVSNPPYVSDEEYEGLTADVKHEPLGALKAGDGLEFYRTLASKAPKYLNSGGALVLEIGAEQAEDVTKLLQNSGFMDIEVSKDYQGRDRIVTAIESKFET